MRKFGIELELNPQEEFEDFYRFLRDTVVPHGHNVATNERPDVWTLKVEHCGYEITSPALEATSENFDKVYAIVEAIRVRVRGRNVINNACGFHVHLDISDLNPKQLGNVARVFQRYEIGLKSLQPISRQNNDFCQSIRELDPPGEEFDPRNDDDYWTSHYSGVNFGHRQTVEIRYGAGTIRGRKVVNWVQTLLFLTEYAKDNPIAPYENDNDGNFNELKSLIANGETKTWLDSRRTGLSAWLSRRNEEMRQAEIEMETRRQARIEERARQRAEREAAEAEQRRLEQEALASREKRNCPIQQGQPCPNCHYNKNQTPNTDNVCVVEKSVPQEIREVITQRFPEIRHMEIREIDSPEDQNNETNALTREEYSSIISEM